MDLSVTGERGVFAYDESVVISLSRFPIVSVLTGTVVRFFVVLRSYLLPIFL